MPRKKIEASQHRQRVGRNFAITAAVLKRDDRREDRQQPGPEE